LADEFLPYRFEEMVPMGPITQETWNVDWKNAMDNYLESYHVPVGHPGLYRMFTPDYEDQASVPGIARGVSWLRKQESTRWAEGLYQRLIGQVATHYPKISAVAGAFTAHCRIWGLTYFRIKWTSFKCCPSGPGKCAHRAVRTPPRMSTCPDRSAST